MDSSILKAALSTLEKELEEALQAKKQIESDKFGFDYEGPTYDDPDKAFPYILNRVYELLTVVLEAAGLQETRAQLTDRWKTFEKNGGIGKMKGHFDFLESKPYEYLKTIIDGLRISTGEALAALDSYELSQLEIILRKTSVLVRGRGKKPRNEADIQNVMHDYLKALFTEFNKSVQIPGVIANFKPDCGIRNLRAAIEFKYADSKESVAKALRGVLEDVSGYSGSRDWIRFYSVIYQTEAFDSEERVRRELTRAGAISWTPVLVTGGNLKRSRRRKGNRPIKKRGKSRNTY